MSANLQLQQPSFPGMCAVTDAVEALATVGGVDERGAIFTRREVVDFVLDLSGYTTDKPLHTLRLLEPSFGDGDFLIPAIERLLLVWKAKCDTSDALAALAGCVHGVELHHASFARTRASVLALLKRHGIDPASAASLADVWLVRGDFLLVGLPEAFDVVVGNPPYVRQELIPAALLVEYRSRYTTLYDRADLYVPFIERSLQCLAQAGVLGFICADRWMKNRYGGPLRALVARDFHLRAYVDMVDTPAFSSDVIAYPAITVIAREPAGATRIARQPEIDVPVLTRLAQALTSPMLAHASHGVRELTGVTSGGEPWILESFDQMALVRRLESSLPTLEEAGCKVGIGVATGADQAFIGVFDELDVEPDRKLPLVTTRDIVTGTVEWRGLGVVNPFSDGGGLVPLDDFPRLKRYLEARKTEISGRHVAQKAPANWYRTIDRITPALAHQSKLLIPDIKGEAQVVFEGGRLYPHHNLYFIVSAAWNLHALQAVLLSGIARFFVSTYSTKMRGGYLRFQAQYLRRIRVPQWEQVSLEMRAVLQAAGEARNLEACNQAARELYGLSESEWNIVSGTAA
jgi:hypothetical protein